MTEDGKTLAFEEVFAYHNVTGRCFMKITVNIDENCEEEVIIYAHEETELVTAISQLVENSALVLIGYKEREMFRLSPLDIFCFTVEDDKVFALTEDDKFQLRCRLYKLTNLPSQFIKINQSCIANLDKIERFDASISGSLQVRFKNGHSDYVSRRNLKNVKERLGL